MWSEPLCAAQHSYITVAIFLCQNTDKLIISWHMPGYIALSWPNKVI